MPIVNWRDVIGYESCYQVSDTGQLRTMDRSIKQMSRWGKEITVRIKGSVKKLVVGNHGYVVATLFKNNVETKRLMHHLVLESFVGPCPEGMECCHNDGDKLNNHVSNLRWDTRQSNTDDRVKHGSVLKGEDNPAAILTRDQVREIRRLCKEGYLRQKDIGRRFGVCQMAVSDIHTGRNWRHLQ